MESQKSNRVVLTRKFKARASLSARTAAIFVIVINPWPLFEKERIMKSRNQTPENSKLADIAAHCKIALDCYNPIFQRAALTAIAKMKREKPSEADIKAVCSDLPARGPEVLDTLINSLLDSLAGLTQEDRVRVTEALIALLPEVEKKFAEQAENNRLLDKILNDILADMSNSQLETILKDVKASNDYVTTLVLAAAYAKFRA